MEDIDQLFDIIRKIHNDNVSNNYYTNEVYKERGKNPPSSNIT